MGPASEIIAYGVATIIFFLASLFARDDEWLWSVLSTGAMMLFWAVNNALWVLAALPGWALGSDSLFTMTAFTLFVAIRRPWAFLLASLYAADVVLDHMLMIGRVGYTGYARTENVIFIVQLATASYPGWRELVTRPLAESFGHMRSRF